MRQSLREEFAQDRAGDGTRVAGLGPGVAFFACRPLGLWLQIAVTLPLPDGVHQGMRPYVRPLVRTRDEHDRFVIALLSQQLSRYFISQIGQVQEVFDVKGVNVAQDGGRSWSEGPS